MFHDREVLGKPSKRETEGWKYTVGRGYPGKVELNRPTNRGIL